MEWVLSISFGELTLKGDNRQAFFQRAIRKIRQAIEKNDVENSYFHQGKFYIVAPQSQFPEMIEAIQKVFGIVYVTPSLRVGRNEAPEEAVFELIRRKAPSKGTTFKVETNRVDKRFYPKSPQFSADMGAKILRQFDFLKVDVHHPDMKIYIDIKDYFYVYIDRYRGFGGLPIGSSGRGLLLLSGGIDSPVAGFMTAKRGVQVSGLHFHSYPFTSDRAEEKVKDLARILAGYVGAMTMYSINILEIQKEIHTKCNPRQMTILTRRFMMRIADKIAEEEGIDILITGESIGQVASQTVQSISVINEVVKRPIIRPLVAMDKTDIIDIAKTIGTYETSILPFEDSCSVFLPDHPVTKPRLNDILSSETHLDIDRLVEKACNEKKVYRLEGFDKG